MQPKISELLGFFTHLYDSGTSYSVLNSSKSALSHTVFLPPHASILEYPQIIKYFKGVYNLRPPTQEITFVRDVKILFDYFNHNGGNGQLSDKGLTATSKVSQLNVDISEILKQGCWKNAKKFFSFYKKDIVYYAPEDVDSMSTLT